MFSKALTRRDFAQLSLMTGVAAACGIASKPNLVALAEEEESQNSSDLKRIRSCCRGCGKMECGVWVIVQNGRAIRVEGDESAFHSMGHCCTKSQASIQAAYHPDRMYYPMKRSNPKGSADPGWVRIDWEEAFEILTTKLAEARDRFGGESIFGMSGTSRIWGMIAYGALNQLVGTPNASIPWQVCKGPRFFGACLNSADGFNWQETVSRPLVYTSWATSPDMSNYDDTCRTIVDVGEKAETHILVDPRLTNHGKEADIWLGLRPGTDGAMALGWLNVILNNDLHDDLFVKKWTNAPFLVVKGKRTPGGYGKKKKIGEFQILTALLTQADLQEGGNENYYMVWDNLGNRLTYFDISTGFWEGEDWVRPTAGKLAQQKHLVPGVSEGWVIDPTPFDPLIDPAIHGEFEITLKDGSAVSVMPVWEHFLERVNEYPLSRVEEITGVDAKLIEKAALTYATRLDPSTGYGNGGIHYQLGVEHSCNSVQNCRLIDTIIGITGNWDVPGGSRGATTGAYPYLYGLGAYAPGGPKVTPEIYDKTIGVEEFPLLSWWQRWSDDATLFKTIDTSEPYPIRVGWCSTGDFMNMSNSLAKWESLNGLDFFICQDLYITPTATCADLLLPAQHWIETDAPRISQGSSGAQGATVKCVEPPADTMHDNEIIINTYKKMGVPWSSFDPNDPWPDHTKTCDEIVVASGLTWNEYKEYFQEHGWWDCKKVSPEAWGTYRRYETGFIPQKAQNAGVEDPVVQGVFEWPGFGTPTKKMELWCTVIESITPEDEEDILPYWIEPPLSPIADPEMSERYPFICTTGRRIPTYFHSEHRQLPWCRELWPVPRIEINPEDAAALGIEQGDWVWIETDKGKIRQTADLYYGVKKGVVNCEHQWWFPELDQPGKGFDLSGVNCLVTSGAEYQDRHCGSAYLRAYAVNIYKATPENSPFGNPVPCGDDGVEIIHDSTDPRLKEWLPTYEGRE